MANHQFYVSSRWQHTRERALRRYHYEDQEAKRYGQTVTATMVHHIYPVTDYPELRLQMWNLLPLSNQSHALMHDRITNKLTDRGKCWQQKRQHEFRQFYAKKRTPHLEKIMKARGRPVNGSLFQTRGRQQKGGVNFCQNRECRVA